MIVIVAAFQIEKSIFYQMISNSNNHCSNISKVFAITNYIRHCVRREIVRKEEKKIGQSASESRGRDPFWGKNNLM